MKEPVAAAAGTSASQMRVSPEDPSFTTTTTNTDAQDHSKRRPASIPSQCAFEPVNIREVRLLFAEEWYFYVFIYLSFAACVVDCVLISYFPYNIYYQSIVLIASSILYVIGIILTFIHVIDDDDLISPFTKLYYIMDNESFTELFFLSFGWGTIYALPSVSVLRCFRIFRMFSYFEIAQFDILNYTCGCVLRKCFRLRGVDLNNRYFSPSQLSGVFVDFFQRLSIELASSRSSGFIVMFTMYFFITYLMSVIYWIEFGVNYDACSTLSQCYITLIRLSLFDVTGFDFLQDIVDTSIGFTVLLSFYMIVCSSVFFYGALTIFHLAFIKKRDSKFLKSGGFTTKQREQHAFNDIVFPASNVGSSIAQSISPSSREEEGAAESKHQDEDDVISQLQLSINRLLQEQGAVRRDVANTQDLIVNVNRILLMDLGKMKKEVEDLEKIIQGKVAVYL